MIKSIRVFISYTHDQLLLVDKLVQILRDGGLSVWYADRPTEGEAFTTEIRFFIEHTQIFMPLVTEAMN
ncbi:MAG: toll/interleukin-1 receptor domain-containing protein [Saprospiraceae bacterium]|nr:toll/interleukin-1 receptor domain-containing protein [Saprospiraceae bacterium]